MDGDESLQGGVANAGAVVRSGDDVLRPSNQRSAAIAGSHRYQVASTAGRTRPTRPPGHPSGLSACEPQARNMKPTEPRRKHR